METALIAMGTDAATAASVASYASMAATAAAAVGTVSQAASTAKQGREEARNYRFKADQANRDALQSQAEGASKAKEERRRANILSSNAMAAAGASGFAPDSPTYNEIQSQIGAEGQQRSLSQLYAADTQADSYFDQGALSQINASQVQSAAKTNAFSTLMRGGGSFYEKYAPRK